MTDSTYLLAPEHPFARLMVVLNHLAFDTVSLAVHTDGMTVAQTTDSVMLNVALMLNAAFVLHPEWAMALHRRMLADTNGGEEISWREWAERIVEMVSFEEADDARP